MKTKLLLLILFLGTFYQSNAQNVLASMKPRPADCEYLSAPDSLDVRQSLKMPNFENKNFLTTQTKLPYPIIFIHGLNSGSSTWNTFTDFMDTNYLFTYGGRFDINLNLDNNPYVANKNIYPTQGADIGLYQGSWTQGADYYYVNFAVNSSGAYDEACANLSNQSAIAKQGLALRDVIIYVMQLTGRDKVILMGHSMGGLAAREYLQNPSNWVDTNTNHHVAKLITTGTPHLGSDAIGGQIIGVDYHSEAIRDLKNTYFNYTNNGMFLFGGSELDDGSSFYNIDVDCNTISGNSIVGLDRKSISTNLDYSCIIGTAAAGIGDIAVNTQSANINNVFSNLTTNIFTTAVFHNFLTNQSYPNMKGLDEPYQYNLAYGINYDKLYVGFITEQSSSAPYTIDYDEYKFNVVSNSQINFVINNGLNFSIYARILNSSLTQVGQIFTINNGNNSFSINLSAGQYYLEVYGIPTSNSYLTPYAFGLTYSLSNNEFSINNSLKIYPNPTSSKVFFDNSISNFKEVAIYNYLGQEVTKNDFTSISTNQEVDMSGLSAGVYILKFSNNETSQSVKIVKQ